MRTAAEAEADAEASFAPKLPVFSVSPMHLTEPSGMLTPPLHTSASVPFRWEEEPGKPRPCTTLINVNDFATKCLELPPRLLLDTILPSPATLLDGPYGDSSKLQSSSFRISRECYGSFTRERGRLGAPALCKRGLKERGWFGSWGRRVFKGKKEVGGCSHVFPSSVDKESDCGSVGESNSQMAEMTRIRRAGSSSSLYHARSHFWATIYDGLKQAVPWGNKKQKKDRLAI